MPMAIATYDQYAMLSVAAPEITGRWEMSEIPGMLKEDGTIDNSSGRGRNGLRHHQGQPERGKGVGNS